jgi:hypothetical protein
MRSTFFWLPGDQIFVVDGQRFGLTPDCRTVCIGLLNDSQEQQDISQPIETPAKDTQDTPQIHVTDNSKVLCFICNNPVLGRRLDRRYCSARCRKVASRGKQLELSAVSDLAILETNVFYHVRTELENNNLDIQQSHLGN